MPSDINDKKKELLLEIENAIEQYIKYRKRMTLVQWGVLLSVTIAGFFTTAAGNVDQASTWFASSTALTTWGLIAAIGSLVIQNVNPTNRAETFERKKDAMRAIRTALKFREMDVIEAAELIEIARRNPSQALEDLSNQRHHI